MTTLNVTRTAQQELDANDIFCLYGDKDEKCGDRDYTGHTVIMDINGGKSVYPKNVEETVAELARSVALISVKNAFGSSLVTVNINNIESISELSRGSVIVMKSADGTTKNGASIITGDSKEHIQNLIKKALCPGPTVQVPLPSVGMTL